ncbi:MAG: isopentenyl phosphate kinase [Elusimicrobia bacterium]|nr:isopentenyl phosphate kinase [Elusimicrobiota bacterium]
MKPVNVFVKLGGSFITDKTVADSLDGARIAAAARALRQAIDASARRGRPIQLALGHGAGSYGHILAKEYSAVDGVHPRRGWQGLYRIRESMTRMNLLFLAACARGGLFPVTVSPFATAQARDGKVNGLHTRSIEALLAAGQTPVIHGDVILDFKRGFTIASTEALLEALCRRVRFDRIVMVSDTDGVFGHDGKTIPTISRANINDLFGAIQGSHAPDVTGGMRKKVEKLFALLRNGRAGTARILRCAKDGRNLRDAVLGTGGGGTLLKA